MFAARRMLVGVALVALVGGCTSDAEPEGEADATGEPSSAASASGTTSEPVETPTETAPALPEEAAGDSQGAAIAFVEHWVATLNYSSRTGDFDAIRELNDPSCDACESVLGAPEQNIEDGYVGPDRRQGGTATIADTHTLPTDYVADGAVAAVVGLVAFEDQVFFDEDGSVVREVEGNQYYATFNLVNQGSWRVLTLGIRR